MCADWRMRTLCDVCRLANENTMKEVSQKMREIHKESDELAAKLAKKERECEAKAEEKVCNSPYSGHTLY